MSLNYRSMSLRMSDGKPASLDDKNRSVSVVAATEMPIDVYDWERGEVVSEILLMSGCQMPESRQVPLLDSHQRYDTSSVIGSCRELSVDGSELIGRAFYADTPDVENAYTKMRDGHLTDYSVGYRVLESMWVPDGEVTSIGGRSFTGPVRVTTKWQLKELSSCPIGADELAKARSFDLTKKGHEPEKKESAMKDDLRAFLEARGLNKDATESQAEDFMKTLDVKEKREEVDVDQVRITAVGDERSRIREIDAMCKRFEVSGETADKMIADGVDVDQARKNIMDEIAKRKPEPTPNFGISMGLDEKEKFRDAAEHSILMRGAVVVDKPAAGADELMGHSLTELARHSLVLAGRQSGGNRLEMVSRALTTSDFPLLLAAAANKSLGIGWETAQETWRDWCGVGSIPDFKTLSMPRAGETDDLDEIPEGTPYKYTDRSEEREQVALTTYGKLAAITRQAIINDDLGALTDIPMNHGEAAARKVGDLPYAVLTANAAMGDSVALFHATHSNLGTAALIGVSSMAAGILAMKTQKDISSKRRLNISPKFLIGPAAVEGAAEVFFRSDKFADTNTIATDSSLAATRVNPYAGSYISRVYDARLDDSSATVWYLVGPKGKTVNVFFLNGQQAPFMETKSGWSVDGMEYKVRIDAAAKALDFRGMYKNPGL